MRTIAVSCALSVVCVAAAARADGGAPPADATSLVSAPKEASTAPKIAGPAHETTATLSAGGLYSTGNSQLLAGSINSVFTMRRGDDGFGASIVGNYGQAGDPVTGDQHETVGNLQGRLRYDRYLLEQMSLFLIGTARNDRFQGLDARFNLDPGLKYLFVNTDPTKLWGELGYDFQYDIRRDDSLQLDANGMFDPTLPRLDKTKTDHSVRAFVGFREAFNKDVTFSTGFEYLQSLVHSTDYRINYDALLAANVGAGFSFGVGFSLRFDHDPLAGKKDLDTTTTLSIIYSYTDAKPPPPPPAPCNCPPPPPPAGAEPAAPPPSAPATTAP